MTDDPTSTLKLPRRTAQTPADEPAFGRVWEEDELDVPWHAHLRPRLVLVDSGAVRLWTPDHIRVLPPGCAAWIPEGLRHAKTADGPVRLLVVSFPTEQRGAPAAEGEPESSLTAPRVFRAPRLLRAMAAQAAAWGPAPPPDAPTLPFYTALRALIDGWAATELPVDLPCPRSAPLRRAMFHLLDRLDRPVGLPDAAKAGTMSERTLQRRCREELDSSLSAWLTRARILRSLELLARADLPIAEVAQSCGYNSPVAFTRAFSQHLGQTPSVWRQGETG